MIPTSGWATTSPKKERRIVNVDPKKGTLDLNKTGTIERVRSHVGLIDSSQKRRCSKTEAANPPCDDSDSMPASLPDMMMIQQVGTTQNGPERTCSTAIAKKSDSIGSMTPADGELHGSVPGKRIDVRTTASQADATN